MIHIENIPALQTIYMPKGTPVKASEALELTFRNTTDLNKVVTGSVTDVGDLEIYYIFNIALGEPGDFNVDFNEDFFTWFAVSPGEYEYTLTANGVTVATGIAIVGDYKARKTEYNKEITYKQYEG